MLHSNNTVIDITDHIADEMRKNVVKSVIEAKLPLSLLIDEIPTLSQKSCLIRLIRLHWLPNRQHVDFKVALLTYSIRYSGEPQHLNSLLMDNKPTRSVRCVEEYLLVVSRTKLSSTSRAFSVAAPKLWNTCHLTLETQYVNI